jgi:hypothetical protein
MLGDAAPVPDAQAPELIESMADALSEFGLSHWVLNFPESMLTPLLEVMLRKGKTDEINAVSLYGLYLAAPPDLEVKLVQAAARSAKFLAQVLELGRNRSADSFVAAVLKEMEPSAREGLALKIALAREWKIDWDGDSQLPGTLIEACGVAWLSTKEVSKLISRIDAVLAKNPERTDKAALGKLQKQLNERIVLGDRTVQQLIESAAAGPVPERNYLRELAIDRARADFAVSTGANRDDALESWGEALLARSRRGAWASARPFAERAREIFEIVGRP